MNLSKAAIPQFNAEVNAAFDVLEQQVAARMHAFAQEVFRSIVMTSPQWSSNLASNWNFSVGSPDTSYTEVPEKAEAATRRFRPYQLGSEPGVGRAIARMQTVMPGTLAQTIYITNATPDDAGGYLVESLESNFAGLRPVNLLSGQVHLIDAAVRIFGERTL